MVINASVNTNWEKHPVLNEELVCLGKKMAADKSVWKKPERLGVYELESHFMSLGRRSQHIWSQIHPKSPIFI